MSKKKLGRNDPCHCGSGKKYKKCHLSLDAKDKRISSRVVSPDMIDRHNSRHIAKMKLQEHLQGKGRSIISTEFENHRVVAVGSKVYFSEKDKTKTFNDFLFNYIRQILSPEWGNVEIKKPIAQRHPILQWYDEICRIQRKSKVEKGKVAESPAYGVMQAYYGLAYNLYLLAHNVEIQDYLITRLKNVESFHSAYYETYVAAWFILAGYKLELENEQDGTNTHCEFCATSRNGKQYSVEAKARQPGKLHFDVGNQLYKALKKNADYERIIFVDLNINKDFDAQNFLNGVAGSIKSREEKLTINGNPAPPAYVFVTNHPYHLHLNDINIQRVILSEGYKIPDFGNSAFYTSLIDQYKANIKYGSILELIESVRTYQIPTTFDGELPEFSFNAAKRRFIIGESYDLGEGIHGILANGIVNEAEKRAYLTYQTKTKNGCIYTANLSNAELAAYRRHPETFFGKVINTNNKAKEPIELFMFFLNGYKDTPKDKLLEFLKDSPEIEKLKCLTVEELRLIYAERVTLSIIRKGN